jgi:hypothetical protein
VRIAKRAVVYAVGFGLFTATWVILGALAIGNKVAKPIPRNEGRDGYV